MARQGVLILGGGVAGLVAARALSRAGVDVDLIEAQDSLGGRVRTWHEPGWPLPIELGPELVHGRPKGLSSLLEEARLRQEPVVDRHHWQRPRGMPRAGTLEEVPDLFGGVSRLLREVDFEVPDMSAESFAERVSLSGSERAAFEIFVRGFHAAPLSEVSIQSLVGGVGGLSDETAQSRPAGGYGALVEWLSRQVLEAGRCRVHLGSRARLVTWQRGHVAVDVQQGDRLRRISGSALLVTLPLGVLAARAGEGGIDFAPYLVQKREALWLSAMAQVTKIVLRFREAFWDDDHDGFEFLHSSTSPFVTFWRQDAAGAQQVTAWAGAPPEGAARPGAGAVDAALLALCELLGAEPGKARAALLGAHFHDYADDPFARGAYSYVRPGGMKARSLLAQPIEGTLFFAGEATDADEPATIAGAVRSAERATREILDT